MLYVDGPEIFVHWYEAIVPFGSLPLPFKVVELVGRVRTTSVPAFAVRDWLLLFTVTVIVSLPIAPWLSVTFSSNW